MKYTLFNYRHAEEIIGDARFDPALKEILEVITEMPLFRYPGKSLKNASLDVLQKVSNTYFDRRLAVERNWKYHPLATGIPNSGLAADFQKTFGTSPDQLRIQAEVQFGNMGRWYSDIFKFQAAYSSALSDFGLSIVPMQALASRIDSNVVNFERVCRELPAAVLSITLPILVIGIEPDANTRDFDLSQTQFGSKRDVNLIDNRYKIVNGFLAGLDPGQISSASDTGPKPGAGSTGLISEDPEEGIDD